ncbi:MAG: cupin domain-containing protein [Methanotrichaceae archaeon]|nr:cupin domain-containing protein [Methanotrichaceae archaeon]
MHIKPNPHGVDVVFYVLQGQGVVEIGEERAIVEADTLIESPAKIPHRWINENEGPLRILVVKAPLPKEATKML